MLILFLILKILRISFENFICISFLTISALNSGPFPTDKILLAVVLPDAEPVIPIFSFSFKF